MIRNKTLIKGFALAALVPLFAACSSEEESPVRGGEPQEVQVSISTRATADGDTWTWQNGDAINLYVTGYGSTSPTTTTLTYTNGAWPTFNATLPATVEACYPETATLTSCDIQTNQSMGIVAADYMTTASNQQLNGTELSLTLEHRLCKVTVTISEYDGYTYSFAVGGYKGDDYYYKMAADIDLSTYTDWTPIDVFFGTFDGNGHAIKNLKRTTFESGFQFGLFDRNTGKIKNLQIEDCNIVNSGNTDSYAAAIANQNGGTIENCHIINGKISAYTQVAGIAITNTGIILACGNSASLNWQAVTEAMNAQLGSYCYRYVQRNGTNQLPVIEATEQSQCPLIKSIGYPCPTVSDTHNEEYQIPLTGQTKQHNV